jgi:hypothetical protein
MSPFWNFVIAQILIPKFDSTLTRKELSTAYGIKAAPTAHIPPLPHAGHWLALAMALSQSTSPAGNCLFRVVYGCRA